MKRRQLRELIFRVVVGYWCTHTIGGIDAFTPWRMVNGGANKYRWCQCCDRWEWV